MSKVRWGNFLSRLFVSAFCVGGKTLSKIKRNVMDDLYCYETGIDDYTTADPCGVEHGCNPPGRGESYKFDIEHYAPNYTATGVEEATDTGVVLTLSDAPYRPDTDLEVHYGKTPEQGTTTPEGVHVVGDQISVILPGGAACRYTDEGGLQYNADGSSWVNYWT